MTDDGHRDRRDRSWGEKRRRSDSRRRSRRLATKAVSFLQALLYPVPLWMALPMGELGGLLAWAVSARLRGFAMRHLEIAFGEGMTRWQRRTLVRRVFLQLGRAGAEVLVARRTGIEPFLEHRVKVENAHHLESALEKGHGAIAVTGHFGNFELFAGVTRSRFDLRVVGRRKREGDPIDVVEATRRRFQLETIPQTQPRAFLRALKDNAIVGILPDQDIDRLDGIFLPFFGRAAYTPSGPAAMALATGAPLVPGFIRREGRSRHRIVWHEPIVPNRDAPDRDAEVRRLTEAWTRVLEEEIRARPDLWVWFHRRWQTTPESLERVRARRAEKHARIMAREQS